MSLPTELWNHGQLIKDAYKIALHSSLCPPDSEPILSLRCCLANRNCLILSYRFDPIQRAECRLETCRPCCLTWYTLRYARVRFGPNHAGTILVGQRISWKLGCVTILFKGKEKERAIEGKWSRVLRRDVEEKKEKGRERVLTLLEKRRKTSSSSWSSSLSSL